MELPKLLVAWRNEEVNPKEDRLVRWLLLLEASEDEHITEILEEIAVQEDKDLKRAMDEWERVSQDESVRLAYEARRKAVLDEQSAMKKAKKDGEKIASERIALKMSEEGLEDDFISRLTGLSPQEVQKLRTQ
ncbi:hypothetical protein AM501_01410 [Aneurinibacillus migulanus]|nr:hypothetical protein AM501_01410 [Aneurinibacillus migulanus]